MLILRDGNGLDLSSRNEYLCQKASNIQGLQRRAVLAIEWKGVTGREKIVNSIKDVLEPYLNSGAFKIDTHAPRTSKR